MINIWPLLGKENWPMAMTGHVNHLIPTTDHRLLGHEQRWNPFFCFLIWFTRKENTKKLVSTLLNTHRSNIKRQTGRRRQEKKRRKGKKKDGTRKKDEYQKSLFLNGMDLFLQKNDWVWFEVDESLFLTVSWWVFLFFDESLSLSIYLSLSLWIYLSLSLSFYLYPSWWVVYWSSIRIQLQSGSQSRIETVEGWFNMVWNGVKRDTTDEWGRQRVRERETEREKKEGRRKLCLQCDLPFPALRRENEGTCFKLHSRQIQSTFKIHSRCIQSTFKAHSRHTMENCCN